MGGRGPTLEEGCHCSVLWLGASITTNFGGVDVVSNSIQKKHPEKLPSASCRRVLYIDNTKIGFAIWDLCWYNFGSFVAMF